MKKFIVTIFLAVGLCGFVKAEKVRNPSDTVVWVGLDYSMVRIVGQGIDLKVPDLIFQDMPRKWNDLFLDERLEGVADSLNKRVLIDIGGVTERNEAIKVNRDIFVPDAPDAMTRSNIKIQDIATAIRSYKLVHTNGLGLAFVVDQFIYHHEPSDLGTHLHDSVGSVSHALAVYVVFFDIGTREVISAQREKGYVGTGGSFRNFWFGPIKNIDSDLVKYR